MTSEGQASAVAPGPTIGPLRLRAPLRPGYDRVLTPGAADFLARLAYEFTPRVDALLVARRERQLRFDAGERPGFPGETAATRAGDWTVAELPPDLADRRVEITGPVDRKMVINALNSGANVFMADFEDSNTPTWDNQIQGQINLLDAVRRTIQFESPEGKKYRLADNPAVLMVRPRGWHLREKHVELAGPVTGAVPASPFPAGLFDFGLYFYLNAAELIARGTGPYFYLPKLQGHLEARLWNDIFLSAQAALGIASGTIRATVLIETLPAVFEMDEILFELREHSAGLNCGRWDYIFSYIKTLREDPAAVLPDRGQVTMTQPFLRSYTQLLIKTCHRRGAHAIGGMAAQIPVKNDPAANEAALEKVRADKLREVTDGHDGTWVAHPALVGVAREIFDAHLASPNQIGRLREDVHADATVLLEAPPGTRTLAGLRHNVDVGVRYLESWLRGTGCVPIYGLMEDAATAEISRAQVWQWIRHGVTLESGERVTANFFQRILDEVLQTVRAEAGPERFAASRFEEARGLFARQVTGAGFEEFLTLSAYDWIVAHEDLSH